MFEAGPSGCGPDGDGLVVTGKSFHTAPPIMVSLDEEAVCESYCHTYTYTARHKKNYCHRAKTLLW